MNKGRVNRLIDEMKNQGLEQMLVSSPASIFYLTGKWIEPGERMLALYININGASKLLVNELFPIHEDLGVEILWHNDTKNPIDDLLKVVHKDKKLGVDKNWPAHFLISLMERNGANGYANGSKIVDTIRMRKDEQEKELMRKASKLNDEAIDKVIKNLSMNKTEKQVCREIGESFEEMNTQGNSFAPIVGYGANGADPHHDSDASLPKAGDTVIIDMGCRNENYCSDMTRTVFLGEPTEEGKKVYNTVLEANRAGIAAVKPGVRFCDIDKAARDVIEKAGYGKYFTHRTGHSIGIEVHDFGDVSAVNKAKVEPGMIFSIEPGVYLSGNLGVRIEDLVMVTEDGCEVLNNYTKEMIVL
ncbi:M24 family metallopeptidase [Inconstantimicrobium mannanitabidum]|uniref:Proline dipeptidase n=1 Tax=Inconstantimicrobium mannanitabidum TaxID=1604901 RepID=A0ACB5RHZ1_9CLOT|nr:Xaa-Pro peptidase family protein [Clostridium sp. TW13]GKX68706.1 proline dipeptidase [Clostridium sp. TW13]